MTTKNRYTNSIICGLLIIFAFLVFNLDVSQTYVTASAPLQQGGRQRPQIALAFLVDNHDAANNLENIITTLDKAQIQATFFISGTIMANHLDLLPTIANKYEFGNCGFRNYDYSHSDKKNIYTDIQLADTCIKALTKTTPHYFTPVDGLCNKQILAAADSLHYVTVLPTDRQTKIDWQNADPTLVRAYATHNVQNGDIIMLKPTVATQQALSQILAYYVEHKLEIISLGQLLAPEEQCVANQSDPYHQS